MTAAVAPAARTTAAPANAGPWQRLGGALAALTGWRRYGCAVLLGAVSAAALPPVYALPLLPIALTGLIWLIDGSRRPRAAFAVGWWFGFGHFAAGLYWVSEALLVEPEKFAWLIPFAVSCIPAYLGLYTGGVALAVHRTRARGWQRIAVFAASWTVLEWLRGVLLTGFPWNPLGVVLGFSDAAVQLAAVLGEYGLSVVVAFACAAPAVLADSPAPQRWRTVGIAALLLAALWGGGALRLWSAGSATVPGVVLRIVQGDIKQQLKWDPGMRDRHLARYLRLSQRAPGPAGAPTHLIWPETAVPVLFDHDAVRRQAAASVVPKGGLLLTGAIRTTVPGSRPFMAWNSLEAIDGAGHIVGSYDKFHLVPFGEYLPLRPLIGWIGFEAVAADRADFTAGPGPRTLVLPGLPPASPLICYEAIFPDDVADPARRPGWLLNVTNDAWFGNSAGPYQHFAIARLRAIEQGLPMVRAANTGISAVFDGYGRVTARLGLEREGVLDAPLPMALAPTPFARFGEVPLAALLILLFGVGCFINRNRF